MPLLMSFQREECHTNVFMRSCSVEMLTTKVRQSHRWIATNMSELRIRLSTDRRLGAVYDDQLREIYTTTDGRIRTCSLKR
jgi:hypothetical protein